MRREEGSESYGFERFISTDNIRVVHDFLKIVITAPPTNLPFFQKKNITSSVNTAYQARNYRYRQTERDLEEEERTACY